MEMEKVPLPKLERLPTGRVPVSSLTASDSPRCSESLEHAKRLAESEDSLPPIVVNRATMRVIDGMHRLRAALLRGENEIDVRFFDGDEAISFVLSVNENIRHGLPLSLADRKSAAVRIFDSYPEWSDRMIATVTGLSAKTVCTIRHDLAENKSAETSDVTVGMDGRVRPRDREHRRELARKLMIADPDASLRAIARQAGISPETARVVRKRLHNVGQGTPGNGQGTPAEEPNQTRADDTRKEPARRSLTALGDSAATPPDGLAIKSLWGDPAFRSTNEGRSLLRMLAAYDALRLHGDQLVEKIPEHCLVRAERAALACAAQWRAFAGSIAEYHHRMNGETPKDRFADTGTADGRPADRPPD